MVQKLVLSLSSGYINSQIISVFDFMKFLSSSDSKLAMAAVCYCI